MGAAGRDERSAWGKIINFKANRAGVRCTAARLNSGGGGRGKARTFGGSCWLALRLGPVPVTSWDLTGLLPSSPFY